MRSTSIDRLPDEVLLMIFEELSPCDLLGAVTQVCKRWAALAGQRALLVERPEQLRDCHPAARGVRVLTTLTTTVLTDFLLKAQYLRDVTICSATPLTSDRFRALSSLRHLEHLDVFLHNRLVNQSMLPTLQRLRSLVINEMVGPHVLSGLAESKTLQALHMYGRSLYFPRRDLMKLLDVHRLQLRELTLRCTELHDIAYAAIGQCECLMVLQLYSCWLMTGAGALQVTRPPRLRRLHVTGARMVRSAALATFLAHLPMCLEELVLSVSSFGDEHATMLMDLPKLRILELWRCRLSGEGVLLLARTVPSLCVLDLNIMLTNRQIEELDRHPSLFYLRCLTERSIKYIYIPSEESKYRYDEEVVTSYLRVQVTNERFPNKYFRSSGEGYRGSLFYYWTQKMDLKPLPRKCIPGFDENDDFY